MTNDGKLFDIYLAELIEWNKKFNLTAITGPDEIRKRHFEDSLALLSHFSRFTSHCSLIDIGTGAGFPGLPLKIACPEIKLTLVEATKKKIEFLKHIVNVLGLEGVEIIWGRAEDIVKDKREQFDLAVARAVAELRVLVELCLPFVKVGGLFIAYKGAKAKEEIKAATNAIKILGGEEPIRRGGSGSEVSLIIIKKVTKTPPKYPRRPGVAKKRPL